MNRDQLLPTWLCALMVYLTIAALIIWVFSLENMELWGIAVSTPIVVLTIFLTKSVLSDLSKENVEKIFLYYWWKKLFRNDYES